jgi:hypothetical protein
MARSPGISCHKAGCDHPECAEAWRAYGRMVTRMKAYGWWAPLVDAQPVREHVLALKAANVGIRRIAALAGVPTPSISKLLYGQPSRGIPPTRRVRPERAAALLSVPIGVGSLAPGTKIDGTGTARRLQALGTLGWPVPPLAERASVSDLALHSVLGGNNVTVRVAQAVRDLYERMWDEAPPETTRGERSRAQRARIGAARKGWAPPLAWDDTTIDDPAAVPEGAGRDKVSRVRKLPLAEDIHWLVQGGDSVEVIAARYDAKPDAVRQSLHRYRKQVAA